jgi:hypothetical protein
MTRPIALLLTVAAAVALASEARAQREAPVWYLDYQVTMKASHSSSGPRDQGTCNTTWAFDRSFAGVKKLDLRSDGANLTQTLSMSAMDPEKIKTMSPAEQLKFTQQFLDAMQYTANWIPGPLEVGDDLAAMRKYTIEASNPVRVSYDSVSICDNMVNEMGNRYAQYRRTTVPVTAGKGYAGEVFVFEMNTAHKKYWISIPYLVQDMEGTTRPVKFDDVSKIGPPGAKTWGPEDKGTHDMPIDWLPFGLKIDPTPPWQSPIVQGTLPATEGRISGEQSFKGSFAEGAGTIPVTLTYKYTLTTTAPARKPASGK